MVRPTRLWWSFAFGLFPWVAVSSGVSPAWAQHPDLLPASAGAEIVRTGEVILPFTDVPPDHWAYQALLNLAGTYGCISGYPDGTFRGGEAVTRYEFAAGLDACLGAVTTLLEQKQGSQQQEVDALIESMEQSLEELRQLDREVQQIEAKPD